MKPKVLKTEAEYEAALAHVETLMDAEPGSPDEDELEVFAVLIEDYEAAHYPIDLPDPIEAIKFRMDQQDLLQKDMTPYMGSQSKVSEVLNRKRPLGLSMIRALHKGLGIPADVLLQEPGGAIPERQYDPQDYPFAHAREDL
jgi:HTH-type transcriptional regulator/antitoxin HigA